jgi:hypothetical protein
MMYFQVKIGVLLWSLLSIFNVCNAQEFALFVDDSSNVGVGTSDPAAKLHVNGVADAKILVENTPAQAASAPLFEIKNNGGMSFQMTNTNANPVSTWKFVASTESNQPGGTDSFRISKVGFGPPIFQIFDTGDAILRGSLTTNSDVNTKQDIEEINPKSVLAEVMKLPISEWSYKTSPSSRHIGPMAQDFYQAFQLGHTDKGISSIDTGGVALAAIKALKQEKDELEGELQKQEERIMQLEMVVTELIHNQSTEIQVGSSH